MARSFLVALVLLVPSFAFGAAPAPEPALPRIGEPAPAFVAKTTQGPIHFPGDYKGKWVLFFSHPADFTPVCTTEFILLAAAAPRFRALQCELVGLSIDSLYAHIAWLRTIEERMKYRGRAKVKVDFPIVADATMQVARAYGMVHPRCNEGQAVRAVFVIDPQGIVQAVVYYPMAVGRSVAELERLVTALQTADRFECATPADWQPGEDVLVPPPDSCGAAEGRMVHSGSFFQSQDWFMTFKKLSREELGLGSADTQ